MARIKYERAVVRETVQSSLSVQPLKTVVLVGNPIDAVMMHDFYWQKLYRKQPNNDVLRIPPSRVGVNSRSKLYRGSQVFGYELIGDMIYVKEWLYDNYREKYNNMRSDEENVGSVHPKLD
jgi:hypothetical protein